MINFIQNITKKNKHLDQFARFIGLYTYTKYKNYKRNKVLLNYGREVLVDFDKACQEGDKEYWLEFGTLLGAIREQNFISNDLDIDVGMYLEDYDSTHEQVLNKYGFIKSRYILIDDGRYGMEETYSKHGVDIDIFYFIRNKKNMYCHVFSNQNGLSYLATLEQYGGLIVREFSFPNMQTKKIGFLGSQFSIPNNYHEHLEANYGNYMIKDKNFSYKKTKNQTIKMGKIGKVIENEI